MKNIKTYYKSHKKAFTMLELIFTIIATGIIMSLSYRYYSQYRWVQAVDKLDKNVYFFANSGVMNTTTGYINATGGNCSSDNSYKNLSAGRMLKCTGYSSAYPVGGVSSDDGTKSWVTNLLKAYMPSNKTCKLYFMEKSSNEYYMFLDCSDLDYEGGSSRAKEFLEQKVNSYIKSNLPTIYQSVNFDSTAINNSTGGNDHDGMLRILMKKWKGNKMSYGMEFKINNTEYLIERFEDYIHIAKKNGEQDYTTIEEDDYKSYFYDEELEEFKKLDYEKASYAILVRCLNSKGIINSRSLYGEYINSLIKDGVSKEDIIENKKNIYPIYASYYPLQANNDEFKRISSELFEIYKESDEEYKEFEYIKRSFRGENITSNLYLSQNIRKKSLYGESCSKSKASIAFEVNNYDERLYREETTNVLANFFDIEEKLVDEINNIELENAMLHDSSKYIREKWLSKNPQKYKDYNISSQEAQLKELRYTIENILVHAKINLKESTALITQSDDWDELVKDSDKRLSNDNPKLK